MRTNLQQFVWWTTRIDRTDLLELYDLLHRIEIEKSRVSSPRNLDLLIFVKNWVYGLLHPKTPTPPGSPILNEALLDNFSDDGPIDCGPHLLSDYDSEAEDHVK